MENYQEQYNQELHQQEINSNLSTLKGYFWIVVTILVLWLLTLTRILLWMPESLPWRWDCPWSWEFLFCTFTKK